MKGVFIAPLLMMAVSAAEADVLADDPETVKARNKLTQQALDDYKTTDAEGKPKSLTAVKDRLLPVEIEDGVCKLTRKMPQRAFPPLMFCFRDNTNSCCMHTQDAVMKDEFEEVIPDQCKNQW